jgi:hypothetical protein
MFIVFILNIMNMKNLTEKKYTISALTLIIGLVLILGLMFGGWKLANNKRNNLKAENLLEVKLRNALIDTVTYYKNSNKEIVAEKLTLQADINELIDISNKLTLRQQELIKRVKEVEKENSIISAALIESEFKLDSIRDGNMVIDTIGNNITITDSLTDIKYRFEISKVKPAVAGVKPVFKIKELSFTNKQFVEFHWGERKEGYPISFSVSNSNRYFKTTNIESYAIPELDKVTIKPNGWEKFTKFFSKSSNSMITFGIGAGVGAAAILLIK